MSRLQGLLFALATLALVVLATFYFTQPWMPPLKSDRLAIDQAIGGTLLLTGVVFIITNLMLAWFSFRYQDREGAKATYWHDNPRLEWTWTLATAAILFVVLFNALGLWAQMNENAPADAMLVEVTGQQFAWNVRYPGKDGILGRTEPKLATQENPLGIDRNDPAAKDDILLLNQLYLPQGRAVRVHIRSMDVIHSFFLPNFRVKQDAMPGMTVQTWFVPQEVTDPQKPLEIACAEHCGLGHYRMRGQVHVVPAAEFEAALAKAVE
jgi:cytochrome c oxidase subunit II